MVAAGVPWTCPAYLVSVACQGSQENSHLELAFLGQNGVTEILILMGKIHVHQNVQMEAHLGSYTLIPLRLPGWASALALGHETQRMKMRRMGGRGRMLLC